MKCPFNLVYRSVTMAVLRRLLRNRNPHPQYEPVARRMMYVAASSLPYHVSGYTTRTHELLRAMGALGAELRVLTRPGYPWDRRDRLAEPESETTSFEDILYTHTRYPPKQRLMPQYVLQAASCIANIAMNERVELIQAASNHVNALPALLAARRLGLPFQYEIRGLWELTRASRQPGYENSHDYNFGLELEGLVASQADRVLIASEQLGQYAAQAWNIPSERFSLLPNCVDPNRIAPVETQGVAPDTIGYAGSLIGYEGLDTLIEAVGILAGRGRGVRLEIVGEGEARSELERLVERLGLQGRICLRGRVAPEAARAMLTKCALVCIPRRPFRVCEIVPPIKLVEALALGKPVIVPDLPVFREELGPEPAGFFFRPGEAGDLASVIERALADPAALARRGTQGRDYALKCRSWPTHVAAALKPFWSAAT